MNDETSAGGAPTELSQAAADFLKALASPTRQRIMMLFARGTELSVTEVAELAGVSQSTASQHLSVLRRGGVLTMRASGQLRLYRSDREATLRAVAELQTYLQSCC